MRQRKRKCETAEVLTSSPFKARLLARIEQAAMKSKTLQKSKQSEKVVRDGLKKKKMAVRDGARKKKVKKVTCREDKRRGRKPKVDAKTARSGKKSKRDMCTDNNVKCLMCGERFGDSCDGECWIECQLCKGWCHDECTDGATSN